MWRLFHHENPFEGFDPAPYPLDLQGWGSTDPLFEVLIRHVRPAVIVEVGTWKGASAIHMARLCRDLGIDAQILCVDTWLGGLRIDPHNEEVRMEYDSMRYKHGWPHLYYQFLANVVRSGFEDMITPLPQTSSAGARKLRRLNLAADLIYIDASHSKDDVTYDLRSYFDLLNPNGVLFGDDYAIWPGVTAAVDAFAAQRGLTLFARKGKFALARDRDPRTIPGIA